MSKKNKIHKIINICLIIIPLIYINVSAWTNLLSEPEAQSIINNLNSSDITEIIIPLLVSYAFSVLIYLFSPFGFFTIGYIIYRIIIAIAIRKNRKHPKFDLDYFRDYLNKISPSYVSYLIDFDIDLDRDVPAHLLKLQLDGYIEEQNNIFIVTNKSQLELNESDSILLDFVKSNFNDKTKLIQYKNVIEKEMKQQEYIKYIFEKSGIIKLVIMILMSQILLFTTPVLSTYLIETNSPIAIVVIAILILLFIFLTTSAPIIFIVKFILYLKWGKIKRTEKGNELLAQIYGLKNFLEDFTNLDDSELREVKIREYYLVYSLVLGVNDKIDDEMLNKIKIQMNKNI